MPFTLDEDRVEPSLKNVPLKSVAAVEPCGVASVEPVHTGREVCVRGLDNEVEVIGEQAIRVAPPAETFDDVGKRPQELLAVAVVTKDAFATIAPRRDVVEAVRNLYSRGSRHVPRGYA
jgi:hypothetical protein